MRDRRRAVSSALTLAFVLFLPIAALGEPHAALILEESEEQITGSLIKARFIVKAEAGARLLLRSPKLEDIKVRTMERSRYIANEGVHQLDVEFVALRPGQHLLGPFTLEVLSLGETRLVELSGRPLSIQSAIEGADSLEPRPRAAPLPIKIPNGTMIGFLYLLMALALLIPLAIWIARRMVKAREARKPPPPPRPPWERALEEIERLRGERKAGAASGIDAEAIEAFTDELSDILRAYLGERYGFDGLESTSDELLAALKKKSNAGGTKPEAVESVRAFLHEADLVKFARAHLSADELDTILYSARRIVIETRPYLAEGASVNKNEESIQ